MDEQKLSSIAFRETETFLKVFSSSPRRGKGQLFLLLDLPDNPGAEDAVAEKLWSTLETTFYNHESDDPYFSFETSLKSANQVLTQENQKRASGSLGALHAIAGLLQDNALHFSHTGLAQISLKRGNRITQISENPEEGPEGPFGAISSGELHPLDMVIISTRSLALHQPAFLEVFTEKGVKMVTQLKNLGKQKDFIGLVSVFTFQGESVPSFEQEPLSDASEQILAKAPELVLRPGATRIARWKQKTRELFMKMRGRMNSEKWAHAKGTVKAVIHGVKSRMAIAAKKPHPIRNLNRRSILLTIMGLLVILAVGFSIRSRYQEQADRARYFENLLASAKNNIAIAENRFLIGEKSDATEFLRKAEAALVEIEAANFFQQDIKKLKNDIATYRDNFDAILRVEESSVYVNLAQRTTVDALGLIHTQDEKNYAYEPRRLFESLLDKVQEELTIDPEEIVISGAELPDFNLLTFLTQNGQVIEYSTRNGRFERAKTLDETWKRGIDVESFNGEFLYLLDPSSNAIWKYRRLRTGYSKVITYTEEGDLSNAVSFAIDGDIYVLRRDGQILRYRKGALIPFETKDQPSIPIKNPNRIFTLPELNNLYILDSENKRVVAYSKGTTGVGTYQKQILFENLKPGEMRDLYVDKSEQKLYVMTSDKILITDL